jgi:2-polyprenyl-3-methyl-5-hydroxy-6-metoxy-1,4-benzoquinol methylase
MKQQAVEYLQRIARRYTKVAVDASKHSAESYYAGIYLDEIKSNLKAINGKPLKVLDVGCGAGRLMTPVAQMGHEVTGIDYHRDSLRIARENLEAAGAKYELIEADVTDALAELPDAGYDTVMAIESIFVSEAYESIVDHMARVLRPGGLMFITHRTRYFYLAKAMANGHYDDLEHVSRSNNGRLRKGVHRVYHHWQTRSDIEQTYSSRGMELLSMHAIGMCSGFGSDPLAAVCDPGELDGDQRRILRGVEKCDDDLLMASRFVLAVVRKPEGG